MEKKNSNKQIKKSNIKKEIEAEATTLAVEEVIIESTIPLSKTSLALGGLGLFFGLF